MQSKFQPKKLKLLPSYILVFAIGIFLTCTLVQAQVVEFQLGSGDVIKIDVFDQPELATSAKISVTGRVVMPLIGAVKVSGLTTTQVESKISKLLADGGFVRRPQVMVTVVQVHSQQVSVLGHVVKPGKYPLEGPTTVIDLLASAGGLDSQAAEVITIIRGGKDKKETISVDTGEFFTGQVASNIELKAGDLVLVPKMNVFYIYGEVRKPGAYRLERGMSIVQALSVGGGLTDRGTQRGIHIKRKNTKGKVKEHAADLNDLLQPNDVVYVKESFF